MQLHHHIIHHVRKHTANIVAHVNKHHKKYIAGAGILSGMAMFKLIGIIVIFLGASRLGGSLGADYYDTEYYSTLSGAEKINITTNTYTNNASATTGCTTGSNITGNNLSGTENNCPPTSK